MRPLLAWHWPCAALSRQGLGATQDLHDGLLASGKPIQPDPIWSKIHQLEFEPTLSAQGDSACDGGRSS